MQKDLIVTTSWDDNSPANYRLGKMLYEYEIKATFYLCSRYDDLGNNYKTCYASDLNKYGFEIGCHSSTHPDLTKINDLEFEVLTSKNELEERINCQINCFCYPRNIFNEKVKNFVEKSGYKYSRTSSHKYLFTFKDNFEMPVTMHLSNHSPLKASKLIFSSRVSPLNFIDWKNRGKSLFDKLRKKGGIYHLYGHAWEIDTNRNYWKKLEELLKYIHGKNDVYYLNNYDAWNQIIKKA